MTEKAERLLKLMERMSTGEEEEREQGLGNERVGRSERRWMSQHIFLLLCQRRPLSLDPVSADWRRMRRVQRWHQTSRRDTYNM